MAGVTAPGGVARRVASLAGGVLLAGCSVVGVRDTPEPPFRVADRIGEIEVRDYGPRIVAETTVPGSEMRARSAGFRRLAGYIFGGNGQRASIAMTAPVAQGRQIAMTAPVAQERAGEGWVIRFFMPAGSSLDALPAPNDPAVRLRELPGQAVAVLRFSGSTAPDAVAARQRALLDGLERSAWRADGAVDAWFYDPPWTLPPFRRNEAVVAVSRR